MKKFGWIRIFKTMKEAIAFAEQVEDYCVTGCTDQETGTTEWMVEYN